MTNQLNDIIQRLKNSPLFYLFLSSRELFHTNFWFWLSTLNKAETLKLFSDEMVNGEELFFKREHNQSFGKGKSKIASKVDLLISEKASPIVVVENKVKDFPTLSQLERIRGSFNNNDIQYVLTTLFFSSEIVFTGWNIKTYREISDSIVPQKFSSNEYYQNLIEDYKNFIFNLSELAETVPIIHSYDFANSHNKEFFHQLNEIKLWESYQKLRASHLLYHFNNRNGIETSYSINHQKATINFFIKLKDDYEIGVSLEDTQFRRYIGGKKAEDFAQNLLSTQTFFTDDFKKRGEGDFCKYDNKGDKKYRYQYVRIDAIPFSVLFNRICDEINKISQQKLLIENHIPHQ